MVEVVVDSVEVVVSSGFVVVLVDVPVVVSFIRACQLTDLESFRGGHGIEGCGSSYTRHITRSKRPQIQFKESW